MCFTIGSCVTQCDCKEFQMLAFWCYVAISISAKEAVYRWELLSEFLPHELC